MRLRTLRANAAAGLFAACALLAACTEVARLPPDAPRLDRAGEGRLLVRYPRFVLSGTAEYGAQLELTREPPFERGSIPAAQTADPLTALFRFPAVPLERGLNRLLVVAVGPDGARSEPATLEVTLDDQPAGVRLTLGSPIVVAGSGDERGKLEVSARVLGVEEGLVPAGHEVRFELSGVSDAVRTAVTDDEGLARIDFTGLDRAGRGTVTATVATRFASAEFVVAGGPAAGLDLKLLRAGDDLKNAATSVTVPAGQTVEAMVRVADSAGNVLYAPVTLFTDLPGASVSAKSIGLTQVAGRWKVVAAINGQPTEGGAEVSAIAELIVEPNVPWSIVVEAPAQAVAGVPVPVSARVVDSYGNEIASPGEVQLSFWDHRATWDAASSRATIRTAGEQEISASLKGSLLVRGKAPVTVLPAPPSTITLELDATDEDPSDPVLSLRASPALSIPVRTRVEDAFGNETTAPIVLSTTAPGTFAGETLRGVTVAGAWEIRAALYGGTVVATQPFEVFAAETTAVALALSSSRVAAGVGVTFDASAVDAYGNRRPDPLVVTVDDLAAADFTVDSTARALIIRRADASPWTVRARTVEAGGPQKTASLRVDPAAPASIAVQLGQSTVRVGETPTVEATTRDRFGNVIETAQVTWVVVPRSGAALAAAAPVVVGGRIYNLNRAGTHEVVAGIVGTSLSSNAADPAAVLTVTPADAAEVRLELSAVEVHLGGSIRVAVHVHDAWGNDVSSQFPASVIVVREGEEDGDEVEDGSWTPAESGFFRVLAQVEVGGELLTDSARITVRPSLDLQPPAISFFRPAMEQTTATWPPFDPVPFDECDGDHVALDLTDDRAVDRAWLQFDGLATPMRWLWEEHPAPFVPLSAALCSSYVQGTRGEILIEVAAADERGNLAAATTSWCLDPDSASYAPEDGDPNRCAVLAGAAAASGVTALGADRARRLVLARDTPEGAALVFFSRRHPYGLGVPHLLEGNEAPAAVVSASPTAFTSTVHPTGTRIVRTWWPDLLGYGGSEGFVELEGELVDRFFGLAFPGDGSLLALVAPRDTSVTRSALYRLPSALDEYVIHHALPEPEWAFADLRLTGFCSGAGGELLLTGDDGTAPVVVRLGLTDVETVWQGEPGFAVKGCAVWKEGLALGLDDGTGDGEVVLVTDARTAPLVRGLRPAGLVLQGRHLFAVASDADEGTLIRFVPD